MRSRGWLIPGASSSRIFPLRLRERGQPLPLCRREGPLQPGVHRADLLQIHADLPFAHSADHKAPTVAAIKVQGQVCQGLAVFSPIEKNILRSGADSICQHFRRQLPGRVFLRSFDPYFQRHHLPFQLMVSHCTAVFNPFRRLKPGYFHQESLAFSACFCQLSSWTIHVPPCYIDAGFC